MRQNERPLRSQPASRPPVDALPYEKLALQAFNLCSRQLSQLETLVTFAATICRNPAITIEERRRQNTLLELLVHTGEQYQQDLTCDRELFQVIALDAKGVAQSRITANRATRLLEESAQIAAEAQAKAQPTITKVSQRKQKPAKDTTSARAKTAQRLVVEPN
ncbi:MULTISPECIES: hypothetical protein [Paraburkholderia]|uniref:hypothetical protein n=1 Tax=Paraburkholderia TaxID=1822464 RepID=UPI002257BB9B|nr:MULTISPECIES: hypothetical protein [Paraburkholderia]MCX4171762.1 hypothetical protein [Paraburkholderia madseniana]MDQ6459771.1 hypothetical protein [Paraburkholderia madseniana]